MTIALPIAMGFIMFSLGIGLTLEDFRRVVKMPKAFFLGSVCQLVVLPLVAFLALQLVSLPPELAFGVMILAFCPGGVSSNMMTKLAQGAVALSISLTAVISLIAVLTMPILVSISARHFLGADGLSVSLVQLGLAMAAMTAVPVGLGVAVRAARPTWAMKVEPILLRAATLAFFVIVIGSIAANWSVFVENLPQLGPVLLGLNIALFSLGAIVGAVFGLGAQERVSLTIETGIQNSAVGVTVGTLIMGAGALPAVSMPAGVYGITFYFVAAPYILWCRYGRQFRNRATVSKLLPSAELRSDLAAPSKDDEPDSQGSHPPDHRR